VAAAMVTVVSGVLGIVVTFFKVLQALSKIL
jgi:hypothetical protein